MSLKAIVVDDEQLAREELCYMLEQMGTVEVIAQAGNGLEAVGIVERLTPDVLFLDVQMPGLNGFEVAHRLIQNGTPPSIVFVTAFDRHADRSRAAREGGRTGASAGRPGARGAARRPG